MIKQYKLPNRKKWLLTEEFLKDLKKELDTIFKLDESSTYWGNYVYLDGTGGFDTALKNVSKKHNVYKAIYLYSHKLKWWESEQFDSEVVDLMLHFGVIKEGEIEESDCTISDEELKEWEENGEIRWVEETRYYKGYHVTKRDWEFVD